jgi:hypothetical protein
MKSYLNKLVARAHSVAPQTPVRTPASPVPDPFEAMAPLSPTPQPLAAITKQIEVSSDLLPAKDRLAKFLASQPPSVLTSQEHNHPAVESEVAPGMTRSNPQTLPESVVGLSLREQPAAGSVTESQRAKHSQPSKVMGRFSKGLSPVDSPPGLAVSEGAEEQPLLQKADQFMARLKQRVETGDNSSQSSALEAPWLDGPRLQPSAPTAGSASVPTPPTPSLVIGRLTVEVVSPPPTASPAAVRRIVTHHVPVGRSSRHSSARFGLGQL